MVWSMESVCLGIGRYCFCTGLHWLCIRLHVLHWFVLVLHCLALICFCIVFCRGFATACLSNVIDMNSKDIQKHRYFGIGEGGYVFHFEHHFYMRYHLNHPSLT